MSPAVFSHGGLRLYLLALLDEQPQHGYDLMRTLAERTGGTYTPSAGTVYPRLAKLEEDGLARREDDGRKAVYTITDAGRAELASRRDELARVQDGLADSVRLIADEVRSGVAEAMKSLRADLAAAAADPVRASDPTPYDERWARKNASRLALHRADLVLGEFRQRVGGGHDPAPGEQPNPSRVKIVESRGAQRDTPFAVAVAAQPPDRPGISATVHTLDLSNEVARRAGGRATHGRGGVQGGGQRERGRGGRPGQHPGDVGREVHDVWQVQDERLLGHVHGGAERLQRARDGDDGVFVLFEVFGRSGQLRGPQQRVVVGHADLATDGAGEHTGGGEAFLGAHEQFWGGPDESGD
jgi:DNA-binding PadR family transcriptional regulator